MGHIVSMGMLFLLMGMFCFYYLIASLSIHVDAKDLSFGLSFLFLPLVIISFSFLAIEIRANNLMKVDNVASSFLHLRRRLEARVKNTLQI